MYLVESKWFDSVNNAAGVVGLEILQTRHHRGQGMAALLTDYDSVLNQHLFWLSMYHTFLKSAIRAIH